MLRAGNVRGGNMSIYVFRHTITEEVEAASEDKALRLALFYYDGFQPSEWELVDVRGEMPEREHGMLG